MKALLSVLNILFVAFSAFGQTVPKVKFNHLFFVIKTSDLAALRNSHFVKNQLTAFETQTIKADKGKSWTGTYMYGSENYFEIFNSVGFQPNGSSGIAFFVDSIGELLALKSNLNKNYKTAFN